MSRTARLRLRSIMSLAGILAVLLLILQAGVLHAASAPQEGIDCGSSVTGDYVDPVGLEPLGVQPDTSPNGIYQVTQQYSGSLLTLSVEMTGTLILQVDSIPNSSMWSFSADDQRFAVVSIDNRVTGTTTNYRLYDLERSISNRSTPVWETTTSLVDTEGAFSPNGKYFQYASQNGATTWLTILDVRTGSTIYETNFNAAPPPGDERVRVAGWGYSPDTIDRTFVYSYVDSQSTSTVIWRVVNLSTGALIGDEMIVNAVSNLALLPFWQFSPCGDAIALVVPSATQINIRLFSTGDGSRLNPSIAETFTGSTVALSTTTNEHRATIDGVVRHLADNTSTDACPVFPPLDSLTVNPGNVNAGRTATGTVNLGQPAPTGGSVVYLTSSYGGKVPASVTVPAGELNATFNIETSDVGLETTVTIKATLGTATKTATLTITPLAIASLKVDHAGIIAGTSITATVELRAPAPAGGAAVQIQAMGSFKALSIAFVPAGQKSADFKVEAYLNVTSPQGTLVANYQNGSRKVDITILRASSLSVEPATVNGGEAVTVTVGVAAPAPLGGVVVPMSTSHPDLMALPPTLLIPAGQRTVSTSIPTFTTDEQANVLLTAGDPRDDQAQKASLVVQATIPTADTSGPYMVLVGQSVELTGVGTDPKGRPLTVAWDLDGDGTFEIPGPTATFTAPAGFNREVPVVLRACNDVELCGTGRTWIRIRNAGPMWSWGTGAAGYFGPGDMTAAQVEGMNDVVDVATSDDYLGHTLVLRADGTFWAMGSNREAELGNASIPTGSGAHSDTWVQVPISNVVAIAAGYGHSVALKNDGSVWTWGDNTYGQAGTGAVGTGMYTTPVQVPNLNRVIAIAAGNRHVDAMTQRGWIVRWGWSDTIEEYGPCATTDDPYCYGRAHHLWHMPDVRALAAGGNWNLILKDNGTVWIWGGYDPENYLDRTRPVQVEGLDHIVGVSVSTVSTVRSNFALALKDDGTVWGWGNNGYGQLGVKPLNPANEQKYTPMQVPGVSGAVSVAGGLHHSIALMQDGTVWSWGTPVNLKTIPYAYLPFQSPAPVPGLSNVAAVQAGGDYSSAIMQQAPNPNPDPAGSITVEPGTAKRLILPHGLGYIDFPANMVTTTTTFTYTEQTAPSQSPDPLKFAGLSFTLVAADQEGNPVTSLQASYTMTLNYLDTDWQEAGITDEDSLNLDYWDAAQSAWVGVLTSEGGSLDTANNQLVAALNHLTEFVLAGVEDTTPPDPNVSAVTVQPDAAAELVLPSGRGKINFPAGIVSATTTFTYTQQTAPSESMGSLQFAGLSFTLVAADEAGNPVTSFPVTYTVTLNYQDSDWQAAGIVDENQLNLLYWDTAQSAWVGVLPCDGGSLDTTNNVLVATLNHLTEFAVAGVTDATAPETSASVDPDANAAGWHHQPITITLTATDDAGGSGVKSITYSASVAQVIPSTTEESATASVVITEEGVTTLSFFATDVAGNTETDGAVKVKIDRTAPVVTPVVPLSGDAVQDRIRFAVDLTDTLSGPDSVALSVREPNGANGKAIGQENLPVVLNSAGDWELKERFDTTKLPDGNYVLVAVGKDAAGNKTTRVIPFSIRNWAVVKLLPSTQSNKAGRTMPIKFSLRVAQAVDRSQPFVRNEELTVKVSGPGVATKTFVYGTESRDYRIDSAGELYIANYQTAKAPMQYKVEIWRGDLLVGSFTFKTIK